MLVRKIFALPPEIVDALAEEAKTWPGGDDRGREAAVVRDALEKRYLMTRGGHIPLTRAEYDLIEGIRRLWRADAKTAESLFVLGAACESDPGARDVVRGVAGLLAKLVFAEARASAPGSIEPQAPRIGASEGGVLDDRSSAYHLHSPDADKVPHRVRARKR